jgi:hypothetical protein
MFRKWVFAMILAGALEAMGAAQDPPRFLTNDDIVSMVKAGQDESTVLSAIQTHGTDFDVSAKALLQLKKSGVPKKVLDAMIGAVRDQREAAAAVLSAAQAKITAAEAEDKADAARAEAARSARANSAVTMAAAMPGQPSVTMVQGGQKQALVLSHTQIVPTNSKASSLDGLASDGSLTQNLTSIAQSLLSNGMLKPGAGIGSTAMLANPIIGPAMIATTLLAKHKANSNSSNVTDVWALPGPKSDTFTHNSQPAFEVSFDGIPGITVDDYEPVLIRLEPSPSNFRLVGATPVKGSEMQSSTADWDMYASFVEQRVPSQATKVASGRYQVQASGGLTPGEYGLVLRPVNKAKKFSGNNLAQNVGDGLVFNCVWSFEVQ